MGRENAKSFREALELQDERRKGKKLPKSNYQNKKLLMYEELADYYPQVKRYLDEFGKEKVYIIIFEKFFNNIEEEYKKLLKFLDVDENFPDFSVKNKARDVKSKLFQKIYRNKLFLKIADLMPKKLMKFFVRIIKKINSEEMERPEIDLVLKKELMENYDLERLETIVGKKLEYWEE